jgi:hypothetical protein
VLAACEGERPLPHRHDLVGGAGGAAGVGVGGAWGLGGAPGPGSGGAPGPAGAGGTAAGAGGHGAGGSVPPPSGAIGAACNSSSDCFGANCVSGFCCDRPCAGPCNTCAATRGTCTPRAAGELCGSAPICDGTGSKLITTQICDGAGICAPGATQDCQGLACVNGACMSTCSKDADCASSRFCSAGACIAPPVNLAGNGDLESGALDGWLGYGGSLTTIALSDTLAGDLAHAGRFSVRATMRTKAFQGPSYALPTGAGRYDISVWGLQKGPSMLTGVVQVALTCATNIHYLQVSPMYAIPLMPKAWAQFGGTIDTSSSADCNPAASPPGMVKAAQLYMTQVETMPFPDLYLDDLVVQVTDGHNLVGNPNFEAALTDGWTATAGTVAVSSTLAKGGMRSLSVTGRGAPDSGPTYALPTGNAKYSVAFQVMHTGVISHGMVLQAAYTCAAGSTTFPQPFASVAAVAPNHWTQLGGTMTLPPPDAPAGCRLTLATVSVKQQETGACTTAGGAVECPDLYIDDVSITLAP